MKNTYVKSYKKSVNNSELNPYGYTRIHVNSDGVAAGTDILTIQTTENGSYVELVNTDAVLSNGSKKYTFPTFPVYGETPANLFPINVGEYDIIIPKYSLRTINNKELRKCTFDLSNLKYSKELKIIRINGQNITGNLTDIPAEAALVYIDFNVTKVQGDINDISSQILNGFQFLESLSSSVAITVRIGATDITGNAKTFLDTIANGLEQPHTLDLYLYLSKVNVDNTTLNKTTIVTNRIAFDGNGGYTITQV
jgi:hypothetical protein